MEFMDKMFPKAPKAKKPAVSFKIPKKVLMAGKPIKSKRY